MIKNISMNIYNNFKIRKTRRNNDVSNKEYIGTLQVTIIDNYDSWDVQNEIMRRYLVGEQGDDAKETALKLLLRETECRSFRVLQLLCENNNIALKNFVR